MKRPPKPFVVERKRRTPGTVGEPASIWTGAAGREMRGLVRGAARITALKAAELTDFAARLIAGDIPATVSSSVDVAGCDSADEAASSETRCRRVDAVLNEFNATIVSTSAAIRRTPQRFSIQGYEATVAIY